MTARAQIILSITFVVLLMLPLVGLVGGVGNWVPVKENRALAPFPQFVAFASSTAYTRGFDAYVADHFGFRAPLIFAQNVVRVILLRATPTRRITVGKEGWLFLGSSDDIARQKEMSRETITSHISLLSERRAAFASQGIDYRVMVVPTSDGVYTEYWPEGLASTSYNRYDQFIAVADAQLPGLFVHTKALLRAHAMHALPEIGVSTSTIYYRYDSHWNSIGAFLGMNTLLEALQKTHACIRPIPARAFSVRVGDAPETTADQLALGPWVSEMTVFLSVEGKLARPCNERLLFIGDSMIEHSVVSWLTIYGYNVAFVHKDAPLAEREKAIASFKPTIVIDERQESRFETLFTAPE